MNAALLFMLAEKLEKLDKLARAVAALNVRGPAKKLKSKDPVRKAEDPVR